MSDSPIQIQATVIGAEAVQAKFAAAGPRMREALANAVKAGGLEVQIATVKNHLRGQALNVRTGRLWRSINALFVDSGDTLISTVGTNVAYGRFWELGFVGVQQVKAFQRVSRFATTGGRLKTQADLIYGPGTLAQTKMLVFARKGDKTRAERMTTVKAHTRNLNIQPRPFLQPALEESRASIRARLSAAIGKEL